MDRAWVHFVISSMTGPQCGPGRRDSSFVSNLHRRAMAIIPRLIERHSGNAPIRAQSVLPCCRQVSSLHHSHGNDHIRHRRHGAPMRVVLTSMVMEMGESASASMTSCRPPQEICQPSQHRASKVTPNVGRASSLPCAIPVDLEGQTGSRLDVGGLGLSAFWSGAASSRERPSKEFGRWGCRPRIDPASIPDGPWLDLRSAPHPPRRPWSDYEPTPGWLRIDRESTNVTGCGELLSCAELGPNSTDSGPSRRRSKFRQNWLVDVCQTRTRYVAWNRPNLARNRPALARKQSILA